MGRILEEVAPEVRGGWTRATRHPNSPHGVTEFAPGRRWHRCARIFWHGSSVPCLFGDSRASAPRAPRWFVEEDVLWPADHNAAQRARSARLPHGAAMPQGPQRLRIGGYVEPTGPEDLVRMLGTAHAPTGAYRAAKRCARWLRSGSRGNMVWRLTDPWHHKFEPRRLLPGPRLPTIAMVPTPVLLSFEHTNDALNVWSSTIPMSWFGRLVVRRCRRRHPREWRRRSRSVPPNRGVRYRLRGWGPSIGGASSSRRGWVSSRRPICSRVNGISSCRLRSWAFEQCRVGSR